MSISTKELGNLAENISGRYLEDKGYEILERNYRKPWGEIDIIAFKDNVIVFVEVKANSQEFAGNFNPELRVDERKIDKILKTAKLYMQYNAEGEDYEWQVDVISVTFINEDKKAKIKHIKNVTADYN
jgi:putative endonuclease